MRLEGTLDAFGLPDIVQLLSFTKKTGGLHLRCAQAHGVVHVRDGLVTSARAVAARQELARRLAGAGVVEPDALADAVDRAAADPATGVPRVLLDKGEIDPDVLRALAAEQVTDAVFELLRWTDGEFAFVQDDPDPDDVGLALETEPLVAEARRRVEALAALPAGLDASAVVGLVAAPLADPVVTRDEWALLALVDGQRTVGDIVTLSGKGEYAVAAALGALVSRGLVAAGAAAGGAVAQHALLARLEGEGSGGGGGASLPAPAVPQAPAVPAGAVPGQPAADAPGAQPSVATPDESAWGSPALAGTTASVVDPGTAPRGEPVPARPEPFTPARRPAHADPVTAGQGGPVLGAVGSAALAPETAPVVERDPSVNKSLLLRLIAGVKGL